MHKFIPLLAALALILGCAGTALESEPVGEAQQALVPEPWDQFVANATIGIHQVLPDGTIHYANAADYEWLGYEPDDWVGTLIQPKHVSQPRIAWMLSHLLNGGTLHNYPAQLWRANGGVANVSIQSIVDFEHGHTRCFTTEISTTTYWVLWAELPPAQRF